MMRRSIGVLSTAFAIVAFVITACSIRPESASSWPASVTHVPSSKPARDAPSADLAAAIRTLIETEDPVLGSMTPAALMELRELYRPASFSPFWIDNAGGLNSDTCDALAVLNGAADEGLDPADYIGAFDRLLAGDTNRRAPNDLARFDVALSSALLRYLRDLHTGRVDPRRIGFRLTLPIDRHDFAVLVREGITGHRLEETVAGLRPAFVQYQPLREMLARYRALSVDGAIEPPPFATTVIRPGEPYPHVRLLARLLVALGDLPADSSAPAESGGYEGALVEGVKRFQRRHGLEPDGVIGRKTLAALRIPLTTRVRQIELTLERVRWLPHLDGPRLVVINIPMFRLWAWDSLPIDAEAVFGMNVIVGRAPGSHTPVLVQQLREVIFRPYWNIPPSIVRHEILPTVDRDPDYLQRERMQIVSGPGDDLASVVDVTPNAIARLRSGEYRLRQLPGPGNAMGLIKFVFPNAENVYLHGTPAQGLFSRSRRDFSHGCVRVSDPVALAEWVLDDRPEWTHEAILAATAGSRTIHVAVPRPLPVILFYMTAAVMPDGTIHFADDIYGHDATLERALRLRAAELRRTRDS